MNKLDKVIKAIEQCLKESEHIDDNPCKPCPYCDNESNYCNHELFLRDALELLKEYKEAKPLIDAISDSVHETAKMFRRTVGDNEIPMKW